MKNAKFAINLITNPKRRKEVSCCFLYHLRYMINIMYLYLGKHFGKVHSCVLELHMDNGISVKFTVFLEVL